MPASALLAAASIASLNLCTDEYLLLLARPQEIASVSFLSQDPLESPLWKQARRHPSNRGSLEQVLRQRPNIVLTMGGGGRASSLIAKRLGMRSVDLRPVSALEDVAFNFKAIAAALGEPERAAPERKKAAEPEEALRRARTKALVRHARAVDAIFEAQERGGRASPEQMEELQDARTAFEDVRPYGSHDAEAAYKKNPELAQEAATGRVNRAVRALQLETELRTDPQIRADRFVERWRSLDRTSRHQYQAGDMSGYKATRSAMGDMAKSLERDPQMESILAGRKRDLGIGIDSGRSLGRELAFSHGLDLGRGRSIGL